MWRRLLGALSLWARHPQALLGSLLFTFLHMACFFGTMSLLIGGMGEEMSFWMIGGLWTFVYFFTLVPISINGLGLQEVSIAYIFPTFGGISQQSALTLALLFRTLVMLASLPGAASLPAILPEARKRAGLLDHLEEDSER
jgi:hypothetical protein